MAQALLPASPLFCNPGFARIYTYIRTHTHTYTEKERDHSATFPSLIFFLSCLRASAGSKEKDKPARAEDDWPLVVSSFQRRASDVMYTRIYIYIYILLAGRKVAIGGRD